MALLRLQCRRLLWRQLYLLLVGCGSVMLLLRIANISREAPYGSPSAEVMMVTTALPPPPPGHPLSLPPQVQEGVWDSRGRWLTFPQAVVAEEGARLSVDLPVTLVTQTSLDRLDQVAELAGRWEGPLSVAVFAPDVEHALVTAFVAYLRRCSDAVRRRVTFSMLVPAARPARRLAGAGQIASTSCGDPHVELAGLLRRRSASVMAWRGKMPYPQNALRNLARNASRTEFMWLVDVDVIPSPGAAASLRQFLSSDEATTCDRCVFVVPTYEVDDKEMFPVDASHLLELVRRKKARPFHQKVLIHNQFATNHSRWEKHVLEFTKTGIIHPVTNFEFFYEPFYVSRNDVPEHDERFVGYGFTRNTQTYETLCAGYKFVVLAPLFAVHWGLQVRKTRPRWREHQNSNNQRLFASFKKDVYARYGTDPLGMMKKEVGSGAAAARKGYYIRKRYPRDVRHSATERDSVMSAASDKRARS